MNKLYLFLTFCILTHLQSYSLDNYAIIQKALGAERDYKYAKAIKYYRCALTNDPTNEYLQYKLGKNYFNQNDYESAIYHMEKASRLMKDSMNYHFDMYHLYSVTGYTALAKESFIRYVNLCPSCVKSDLLPGGQSNRFIYSKPIKEAELMGYDPDRTEYYSYIIDDNRIQTLNQKQCCQETSRATDFEKNMAYLYSCHDFMFFDVTRNRMPLANKNHRYGPYTISQDKQKLYITKFDKDADRMFIYYSKRDTNEEYRDWRGFEPLEIEIDKGNYDYIHPMLTEDGKYLIFASNQPGGLGGYDLWIGEISNNTKLKNIKNLGTYVNTPGDECFPTIYDDKVIFFASNGHYGLGNLDIYAGVRGKNDKFNRTFNLGNNFNSADDDYALFYHKKKNVGYFTSNRFRNECDMSFDRIYKQGFDRVKARVTVKDELNRPIENIKVSIPAEKFDGKTNQTGQISTTINPAGYKKIIVASDNHELVDTAFYPFETDMTIIARRKLPKDMIMFSLLSHPFENAFPNVYYKITNTADCTNYSGYTDESGVGQVVMYANEDYRVEVPELGYVSPKMKFEVAKNNKVFVSSDLPAKENVVETKSAPAVSSKVETPLKDNFTIYYETTQWAISQDIDRQIQYVIAQLNQHPSYRLELQSHTDCQGDAKANLVLSKMRLDEAIKYFFSRGASEAQIVGRYFGESKPANNCQCDGANNYDCSNEELRKNRRTEVKLIR